MNSKLLIDKVLNRLYASSRYERISYSQCGEDLIVNYIFQNIIKNPKPSYIDIGAHHPFNLSNTALFYKKGYKGINIEPNPLLIKQFKKHRKKDVNLNIGIGEREGKFAFYNLSDPALSTFVKEEAEILIKNNRVSLIEELNLDILPINSVIEKYSNSKFPNFLSLDVEGLDEKILHTIDFNFSAPDVICVETIKYGTDGKYSKNDSIINFLTSKGYCMYGETRINTIFIAQQYMDYSL